MRATWRKDLLLTLRSPAEIVLSVAAPLLLLALASWIFTPTGRDLPIALVQQGPDSPATARLEAALTSRQGEPLYLRIVTRDPTEAERLLAEGQILALVVVPPDLDDRLAAGEAPIDVVVWNGMGDLVKNTDLSLRRAIQRFAEDAPGGVPVRGLVDDPRTTVLTRPGWFAGGMVGHALMFTGFLTGGIAVAREWEDGTLPTLRVSPAPGWRLATGKVAAGATAALASAMVVGAVGIGLTDLRLRGDPVLLVLGLVATAVLTAAIGVLLGLAARRYYLMMPLAGIGAVVLWFLGGGFSDLTLARGTVLDAVSRALPTTPTFRVLFTTFQGGGWPEAGLDLSVLAATAAGVAVAACWAFHRTLAPRLTP